MLGNSGLQVAPLATVFVVLTGIVIPATNGYFIPDSGEDVVKRAVDLVRDKRYTDTQERASSFCTGLCMYEERKAYSDCFDLCNWNGRGPSPWNQLDRMKSGRESENSVENFQSMMRTGAGGGGGSKSKMDKNKPQRGRSGTKKEYNSWGDLNY